MTDENPSCVVLLSGGMDSSTLLAHVLRAFPKGWHSAISFNYNQRHVRELRSAAEIARFYQVDHKVADLRGVGHEFMYGSSQTSKDVAVPHGHYTDESMRKTVVPNRNMVMLSIATAWAVARGASVVAYAAHAGDHAIYPDCRPEFIEACAQTIAEATDHSVSLFAPYQSMTKADILKEGLEFKVPYQYTWTCYEGDTVACGKCGTCVERLEAFALLKSTDPLRYVDGVEVRNG